MRMQERVQYRSMMTRPIVNKQTDPPPTQQQLSQEPDKRFLILLLGELEHERTLASGSKDMCALVFAVYNHNWMSAFPSPPLLYYRQKTKCGFVLAANYKPSSSIIACQPGSFFLNRSISSGLASL